MNISRPHQDRTKGTSEEGKGQIKFEESDSDDSNGDYKHNNDDTVDDDSKGNDDKDDDDDKRGRASNVISLLLSLKAPFPVPMLWRLVLVGASPTMGAVTLA